MSQHVPDDLLSSFVEGEVADQVAAHVAEHLDRCPACATRAAALEPLAMAFAAVCDPRAPASLPAAILARAAEPERTRARELWSGAGLLVAAFALLVASEGPLAIAADVAAVANAAAVVGRSLTVMVSPFQISLVLGTLVTLLGSVVTLHLASTHLLDGREVLRRIR